MASKREIAEDIRQQFGNVLSQNQVQKYLGRGDAATAEFLQGVPFVREHRKKNFLAIDIARRLYELQQAAY